MHQHNNAFANLAMIRTNKAFVLTIFVIKAQTLLIVIRCPVVAFSCLYEFFMHCNYYYMHKVLKCDSAVIQIMWLLLQSDICKLCWQKFGTLKNFACVDRYTEPCILHVFINVRDVLLINISVLHVHRYVQARARVKGNIHMFFMYS